MGEMLYVTNSDEGNVRAYDLDRNGDATNERVLISGIAGVPGGIRIDEKGNLFVTGKGVFIYSPQGKQIQLGRNARAAVELRVRRGGSQDALHHRPARMSTAAVSMPAVTTADIRKRPLVGVGALVFKRDRILMAQRGKEPLKGWWSLPGGALETGETLKDAIRREVLEETGLEVDPQHVFEVFERIMRDATGRHRVSLRADRLSLPRDRRLAQAGDDVSAVEWVRRRDLAGTADHGRHARA